MFVDTNVLVKARVVETPDHNIAKEMLERAFQGREPVRISRQIPREYLSVVTRPQAWPVAITLERALGDVVKFISTFETAPWSQGR